MADEQSMAGDAAAPAEQPGEDRAPDRDGPRTDPRRLSPRWSQVWQVPTIIVSLVLIAGGLHLATSKAPENDFDGALDEVDALISEGILDEARSRLQFVIEPHIGEATAPQQARFHATLADWLYADQTAGGVTGPQRCREIVDLYHRARGEGLMPGPARLERWAEAALVIGDLDDARRRLDELEALSMADGAPASIRGRRNRVLRRIVDHVLAAEDRPYQATIDLLEEYRADDLLEPADEVWAVARLTEVRLADDRFHEAIDHLLLEMRRIVGAPPSAFGELYVLLGRAYMQLGDPARADFQLRRALETIDSGHPARGQAILLLGQLAVLNDDLETAIEHFDTAVRDYPGTAAHPAALLGRAECEALLGRHPAALEDYRTLAELLPTIPPTPLGVDRAAVGRSLIDRHDAAVAAAKPRRALPYAEVAARLYPDGEAPADVLFRLAVTNRQIADDMIGVAAASEVTPEVRYEASRHYQAAAAYAVAHLRALIGVPGADAEWSASLWLAADSYDLSGDLDEAARHFAEYIAGRSAEDERRAAAMERLGAVQRARGMHAEAIDAYERLRAEYPNSIQASRSAVPLARSLVAVDRGPEAEALLLSVVAGGDGLLEPTAVDYHAALLELGTIYHARGAWNRAIERLTEVLERYPQATERREALFRLADSYRGEALSLGSSLANEGGLAPAVRGEMKARRREYLLEAARLYRETWDGLTPDERRPLDRTLRDIVRLAHLYEADCSFLLGNYADAVPLYELVVRRYGRHHASITALVQIVNCYSALGQKERAAAAQERAMVRLRELPESAFTAPDSLLDRAAWERWMVNFPPERVATGALN